MSERYPDDGALLAMTEDAETGVQYITTGRSPYYLEFRRLVQRLLRATTRANDLRVYADGDLSIGVRGGRCVIGGEAVGFAGLGGVPLSNNATTHVWLDATGSAVTSESGLPADRTAFIPLAQVTTAAGVITQITDLRGESMWLTPDLSVLGVTATAAEINAALDGAAGSVDAAALSTLTAGPASSADAYHRHEQMYASADAEAAFRLINDDDGSTANIVLRFDLPAKLPGVVDLLPDPDTGFLAQRYLGQTYTLVGSVHTQHTHAGGLTASVTGALVGVVPIDGEVVGVILSLGSNIESDTATDGVAATAYVNGATLTTTHPAITDAAGAGFRSTAQGDGTAAIVRSDGGEQVSRGDVLTVDLTRTAAGSIGAEASDAVVLIVIQPNRPR